jgi:ribonuclease HI
LITIFFDGLCQPVNPAGIACYAYLIKKGDSTVHSEYGLAAEPFSKDATNNVAEYTALIKSLEWLSANLPSEPVTIKSDSTLVVRQMNGQYKVKSRRIVPLYRKAVALKDSFRGITIKWIPREENWEADALTNQAYKEALAKVRESRKRDAA